MSYRWAVVIGLVSVVNSAAMLVSLSVGIMLPDIKKEFVLGPASAGVLGAVSPLATILLSVPMAAVVSRFNPRLMIFGGAVHMAVFAALMGWAPNYPLLLTFRFLFMLGLVSRQANMAMLIAQWFEKGEVPRVQSVVQVISSSVQIAAFVILPWLLVWLSGWRATFYALAALIAVSAAVWLVVSKDKTTDSAEEATAQAARVTEPTPLAAIFRYKVIWFWGVATAFCLVGVSSFTTFWPTYLHDERGLSLKVAGLLTAGIPLGNVVGALHASAVRRRVTARRQQMYITGVLCTVSMFFMALMPAPYVLPIGAFGLGWACMQVFPTIMTLPYELPAIRPREIAVVSSFMFTLFTLGLVIGPILTGIIEQASGSLRFAFMLVPVIQLGVFLVAVASEEGLPPTPGALRRAERREPTAVARAPEEAVA